MSESAVAIAVFGQADLADDALHRTVSVVSGHRCAGKSDETGGRDTEHCQSLLHCSLLDSNVRYERFIVFF
ncbi:hypothetical protein [Actinopolyspora mortivallis]|uniref:hypothetical protein n=1 Tax=Actinopolyspora mortivallis TaxID=33906 RepID=UPI00037DA1DC|nr:hypothetical protein [Actinopolyspora mortivallis]